MSAVTLPFGEEATADTLRPRQDDPTTIAGWLELLTVTHWRDVRAVSIRALAQGNALQLARCDRHPQHPPMRLASVARHLIDTESEHEQAHPGEPALHVPGDLHPVSIAEQATTEPVWIRSTCRSCRADVIWAKTAKGRMMPVDAPPDPAGNVYLVARTDEPGEPMAMFVGASTVDTVDRSRLRTSHFATCPNADRHRGPRGARR